MEQMTDTIAAISTPKGKGGVALIRISGSNAVSVGEAVFSKSLSDAESNKVLYGKIYMLTENGQRRQIDDGMAVVFRAPASFTGEDTVEICCHGGVLVTKAVLTACLAAGARPAMAGEFTRRSYINGKTRLDSAEALGALLDAATYDQMLLARSGMSGRLAGEADALYDKLLAVAAELRADIDFPDEDVSEMPAEELRALLCEVLSEAKRLAGTYKTGKAINEGIETVICGRTNSGKSSLYNAILGQDAAIVTDIEGTTRDILSDTVSFGGVTLHISDTAGLRNSTDPVEAIGIERAMAAISRASLVLAVIDGSRLPSEDDIEYLKRIRKAASFAVAVINKSDMALLPEAEELSAGFNEKVILSAKQGEGLDRLASIISKAFLNEGIDIACDAVVANERQYGVLIRATDNLRAAIEALDAGIPLDIVGSEIECALSNLAEIGGKEASEDIIGSIFSKFCVGK